jgi:hypothetical protein
MSEEPSRQRILDLLQTVHDRALEAESFTAALKALEMIGREIGMWREEKREEATLAELIAGTPRVGDGE